MREVLDELMQWWEAGETVGVGTVVATFRSAPRPPGASMLVGEDGTAVGSVSGGCVEGAVYELAQEVTASGRPVLQRYGVSDDDAFAVGLTCGGILDVFVEKVDRHTFPELGEIAADIRAGRPVAVATVVEHPDRDLVGRRIVVRPEPEVSRLASLAPQPPGPEGPEVSRLASLTPQPPGPEGLDPASPSGSAYSSDGEVGRIATTLGSQRIDDAVRDDSLGLLAHGQSATLSYGPDGERRGEGMRVFVWAFAPRPRMLVFGAIDFAAAVARVGSFLGYRVTVCDARPVFATRSRFPEADEVIVDWPHRYLGAEAEAGRLDGRTVVTVLTHDPKFDVPLLEVALRLPELGYIGAMGSRRTHDDRERRLREAGLTDAEIGRLASPIGLDLGARTPEETAVSIAAEIIAERWGGSSGRLKDADGAIHGADARTV